MALFGIPCRGLRLTTPVLLKTRTAIAPRLQTAGFRVIHERSRRTFAIDVTERVMAQRAQTVPPPLGLHLLLGEKMPEMGKNTLAMMKEGLIEPVELFARAS